MMASTTSGDSGIAFDYGEPARSRWVAGAIGGFAGGVLFGILLQMMGMMPTIGMLVGVESAVVGWLVHLVLSVAFGLVFAATMMQSSLDRAARRVVPSTAMALGYGVVLWIVAAGIVMPLWLGAVAGLAAPVPYLTLPSLVGHLVYGIGLGVAYPLVLGSAHPSPGGARTA